MEQTLSLIKPDAVERNLIGKIVTVFVEFAQKFYEMHSERPFFKDLCSYISSGPLVAMVLEGDNAIQKNRDLMGATNPSEAQEGTIRKMFAISIDKNSVHGSDSSESSIDLFFKQ